MFFIPKLLTDQTKGTHKVGLKSEVDFQQK